MELYYIIAVTDRDRAGEMAELYQAAGLHLALTTAFGVASSP